VRQALSTARTGPATAQIRDTMVQIFAEFAGRRFGRAQVLRGLCALLTALVARELVDDLAQPGIDRSADRAVLLQRFEALIEAHYLEHLGVADYARALAVTPTHLSRVARTATGRSAQQMIQERMIREARRQLVYTGQPVSAVAYALGYADPAYFSRVFSGATGLSPRDFRARVHGEPHAEARLDSVTGEITA
jgi:AraC family transcriptional activator of pobA